MPAMNDALAVEKQYANADGLNARIALHQKYSVDPLAYDDWVAQHYHICAGEQVLELGCGTASIWHEPDRYLPSQASLMLTDLSPGMLTCARSCVPVRKNIAFALADIQDIPFPDASFDVIIANAMLYHVPNLPKALQEIARVLKPDGRFLCATTGERTVGSWLRDVLGRGDERTVPFTVENGTQQLAPYFQQVRLHIRSDALHVTNVEDLAAYVLSMTVFSFVRNWPQERLKSLLAQQMVDGIIRIPKENGLFECKAPIIAKIFD